MKYLLLITILLIGCGTEPHTDTVTKDLTFERVEMINESQVFIFDKAELTSDEIIKFYDSYFQKGLKYEATFELTRFETELIGFRKL